MIDFAVSMGCNKAMPKEFHVTQVLAAIYQEKGSRFRFRGERHAGIYELFCLDRGRAYVRCDGRRFLAAPGDCMLYPPGSFHQHQAAQGQAPHYLTVAFTARGGRLLAPLLGQRFVLPPGLRSLLARVVAESRNPVFRASVPHRLQRTLRSPKGEAPRTGSEALQRALLTELLIEWLRLAAASATRAPQRPLATYHEFAGHAAVGKAFAYLQAHLAQPVSLEAAARAAGVSPPYLRQLAREHLGRPLRAELRRLRIQEAKHLLSNSARNVKEVAAAVGYENVAAFSRAFRAVEGLPPSQYAQTVGARAPALRNAR